MSTLLVSPFRQWFSIVCVSVVLASACSIEPPAPANEAAKLSLAEAAEAALRLLPFAALCLTFHNAPPRNEYEVKLTNVREILGLSPQQSFCGNPCLDTLLIAFELGCTSAQGARATVDSFVESARQQIDRWSQNQRKTWQEKHEAEMRLEELQRLLAEGQQEKTDGDSCKIP